MARNQSRRQARELAFQVLYSLFFTPAEDEAALRRSFVLSPHNLRMDESNLDDEPEGFAWDLTHGVWSRQGEIDGLINRFSHHWRTEKMGKIELTLLRIAVHELVWLRDSPPRTIINEALELADQFGASGAKQLINGILDAVARNQRLFSLK